MRRNDAYQLVNLGLGKKMRASLGLLLGLGLFFSAWIASVAILNWGSSVAGFVHFGGMLTELYQFSPRAYVTLFALHAASLGLLLGLSHALFVKTALPRVARGALVRVGAFLAGLDLLGWALLPISHGVQIALGPWVGILAVYLAALVIHLLRAMWSFRRWPGSPREKKRVVVVGGGFAGLYTAMGLDAALGHHAHLEITVIDKNNFFLFPPLLPSIAAGAIETRQVTYPFRRIFEATNVIFKKENVESIDTATRTIRSRVDVDEDPRTKAIAIRYAETRYDYLVLAPGSTTQTFGTPGVEEFAFFMREIGDAVSVRNHVIDCFERAARETDPQLIDEMLRFVVVGAGPTGVELASEIRDLIDEVLAKHYPEIDPSTVEVALVQSGDRILPGWADEIARAASEQLAKIGVGVKLGARVVKVGPDSIEIGGGQVVPTRTCVWCAGVRPVGLLARTDLRLHASGRAEIEEDCRAKGRPEVFVLGDAAFLIDPRTQRPFPPLGQVAFQQGAQTASNLVRLLSGRATRSFSYFDYGQLVSVGAHYAAVSLMGMKLTGFIAWIVWRTLYLSKLVGFGNKVRVMLDWSLDLLIERSISQLHGRRESLEAKVTIASSPAAAE